MLEDLAKYVLIAQPSDLYQFALKYFKQTVEQREAGKYLFKSGMFIFNVIIK